MPLRSLLPLALLALCLTFLQTKACAQNQPVLRGLGEPAAPSSMANPGAINPPSPASAPLTAPPSAVPVSPEPKQSTTSDVILKPIIQKSAISGPMTLHGAVTMADDNYPAIIRANAELNASRTNVTVQKLNEYLPEGLFQTQEVFASRNKLTEVFYGSPVFPASAGPGFPSTSMDPFFYSGLGFNFDWAPLDFGLHKARINLSKQQYANARSNLAVTKLEVEVAAAAAFLDAVETAQQVVATQENVHSFESFATIVNAQVNAQLKPGADAALAAAQLANARNQQFRAQLNFDVAKAALANALGAPGVDLDVVDKGIATLLERGEIQRNTPVFEQVPILAAANAQVLTALAQRRVLNKEYFPVFHWLAGFQLRGSAVNTKGVATWQDAAGVIPVVPNYQLAMIMNWNFMDGFRLHYEKKVQDQRILAQRQQATLILNNLKTEDVQSRARLKTAISIAENMPVQVQAAELAARQAQTRYRVGLSSVAQVAEANQVLAQSRMQEAVAKVGIWRAMLGIATVHGDLQPFLAEADRVQRGM